MTLTTQQREVVRRLALRLRRRTQSGLVDALSHSDLDAEVWPQGAVTSRALVADRTRHRREAMQERSHEGA